jgi:hypothetical protein
MKQHVRVITKVKEHSDQKPSGEETHPYSVTLLTIGSGYFRAKPSPVGYPNYSQI